MDELEDAMLFVRENGMAEFVPNHPHYEFDRSDESVLLIPLTEIAPVIRSRVPRLDNARGISVLDGFQSGSQLPQIFVIANTDPCSTHRYRLLDGYHRMYLSLAVGYLSIPAEVFPDNRHLFENLRV
ncbi:hypothetical protein N5C62_22125 [Pseudomonas atacamensis]|uniref:hypothetical protein n=1 Tax=Pseudomonas atacamensis TaxID=2565368 RepID=UPI0024493D76|nr:hypothetical protein [Pseudomonas atacamensis]MDH1260369.1 hypothetical protein [Pseudomonas atacamensis]